MTTAATALPLLGLRITAGPVELRGVTDDLLGPLAELAIKGVHDPDFMPFFVPWSIGGRRDAEEHGAVPLGAARQLLAGAVGHGPGRVLRRPAGRVAGVQRRDFLVTRIGETGSWLGREFHGRGIGTAMRKVICAFIFDYLGAEFITSSAYTDNPASLGVSRKCGYRENGVSIRNRMDKPATSSCSYSNLGTSSATNTS